MTVERMLVVQIGYHHYAMTPKTFAMLFDLVSGMTTVTQRDFREPYLPANKNDFIMSVYFEQVDLDPAPDEKTLSTESPKPFIPVEPLPHPTGNTPENSDDDGVPF